MKFCIGTLLSWIDMTGRLNCEQNALRRAIGAPPGVPTSLLLLPGLEKQIEHRMHTGLQWFD